MKNLDLVNVFFLKTAPILRRSSTVQYLHCTRILSLLKIFPLLLSQHGQGLGAQEQGMSSALSVEKTSKRGGRIVHEKDLLPPPPPPPPVFAAPAPVAASREGAETPPSLEGGEYGDAAEEAQQQQQQKPSITDLMRNPSKVVLCKV